MQVKRECLTELFVKEIYTLYSEKVSSNSLIFRFILEPKSLVLNEQEQKYNDSEAALTSLQVCHLFSFATKLQLIVLVLYIFHFLGADFKRIFGEANGRGGEQPEGVARARPGPCTSDYVYVCDVKSYILPCINWKFP